MSISENTRLTTFYTTVPFQNDKYGRILEVVYAPIDNNPNRKSQIGLVVVNSDYRGDGHLDFIGVADPKDYFPLGSIKPEGLLSSISISSEGYSVTGGISSYTSSGNDDGLIYTYQYADNFNNGEQPAYDLSNRQTRIDDNLSQLGSVTSTASYGHFVFIRAVSSNPKGYAVAVMNRTDETTTKTSYMTTIYPPKPAAYANSFGISLSSYAPEFCDASCYINLVVGATTYSPDGDSCGAFFAYRVNNAGFKYDGVFSPPDCKAGQLFGQSLSLAPGNANEHSSNPAPISLAVGAPGDNEGVGAVYLYVLNRETSAFTFEAKVTPSGIQNLPLFLMTDENDEKKEEERVIEDEDKGQFGLSLSCDSNGQQVVIGAPALNFNTGAVFVLSRETADDPTSVSPWKYFRRILEGFPVAGVMFGSSVRFLGSTYIYISAPLDFSNGNNAGMVYQAAAGDCPQGQFAWGENDLCGECPTVCLLFNVFVSFSVSLISTLSCLLSSPPISLHTITNHSSYPHSINRENTVPPKEVYPLLSVKTAFPVLIPVPMVLLLVLLVILVLIKTKEDLLRVLCVLRVLLTRNKGLSHLMIVFSVTLENFQTMDLPSVNLVLVRHTLIIAVLLIVHCVLRDIKLEVMDLYIIH